MVEKSFKEWNNGWNRQDLHFEDTRFDDMVDEMLANKVR